MTAERRKALISATTLEEEVRILTGLEWEQLRERYLRSERPGLAERVRNMTEQEFRNLVAAKLDCYLD